MKRRKKITNFYIEDVSGVHVVNIVNGVNHILTTLIVAKNSFYIPPDISPFLDIKYLPEVRLVYKENKLDFSYYIYDITITLENDTLEITDEVLKYLNSTIFDLEML